MDPTTCSATYKKFPLFSRSLAHGPFLFYLFLALSFIFQIHSFQLTAAVSGDPGLYNLELTVHVIMFPLKLLGFIY
jgi:hypothetical protein